MGNRWRVVSYFMVALFLVTASPLRAQFGFTLDEHVKKVRIPFTVHSNLIVVPLILNERLPLKFIVDTGVRNAILTEKTYSDLLEIPYSRKYTITGAGGSKLVDAYVTNNVTLSLPGVDGSGHAMLVLEEDYIKLRNFLGTEVHGMLGYELFSRFVVSINYQKGILTLIKPDNFRPPKNYIALDLTMEDTKPFVHVPVTFEDGSTIQAKLLVDTGASHGLMLDPQSGDSVKVPQKTLDANIGRGLAGKIEGQIGRINKIKFGKYELDDPIVTFPYPDSYMDSLISANTFRNGTLGGEVLSRFNLIFDYPNEKLYIKRNASFRRAFFFNMSGITVKAKGSLLNRFDIEEVRPSSSAAEAGMMVGDELITINGISVNELSLKLINGYLNSKPGKRVRIEVVRKGRREKVVFRLKTII